MASFADLRVREGDTLSAARWNQLVEMLQRGPQVAAPLAVLDGVTCFADHYQLFSVKTTGVISARSGEQMGQGDAEFWGSDASGLLTAAPGYRSITVWSKFGVAIAEGIRGGVAWVDDKWELIWADCSGVA